MDDLYFFLKLCVKTLILSSLSLVLLMLAGALLTAFYLCLQICLFLDELLVHLVGLCYPSLEAIDLLLMQSQQLFLLLLETRLPIAQPMQFLIK
jgi:hypothetical protein